MKSEYKINSSRFGNGSELSGNSFGSSVTNLGDLDNDNITDIAVGEYLNDDGGTDNGAAWILFLNTTGGVKSSFKINSSRFGNGSELSGDNFGISVSNLGDLNNDGIQDIAVGEYLNDDGGTSNGAVWILFLNRSEIAADTTPPSVTSLTEDPSDPAIYSLNAVYEFNTTITDASTISSVQLEFNGVNYTASATGNVYNATISNLAVGTFNYRWFANDSLGYTNNSETGTYTVNQQGGEVNTFINGTRSNFSANNGTANQDRYLNASLINGTGNIQLYVNGSLYNNGTSPIFNITNLSIGFYNITGIYLGNTNFTSDTEVWWVNVTIAAANNPPQIVTVFNNSMTSLSSGPNEAPSYTSVIINFSVTDADGASTLNSSTATINFTRSGETTRQNTSCSQYQSSGNNANYTCNVTMWWWDGGGTWNITAFILDNSSSATSNSSTNFFVGSRTAFVISPTSLSWPGLAPGSSNKTSNNDPLILNNTGNYNISLNEIGINATDLLGETDSNFGIWAGNISVSTFTGSSVECNTSSIKMNSSIFTNITSSILTKGNFTTNNGTAQEELYFCIRTIGSELTAQSYSTANKGSWTVRILLVAVSLRKLRKKKSRLERNISIPITIFTSRLGALEAISKYMKENLGTSYHKIAELLNRDDRTIWTAYKKASKKLPSMIKVRETEIFIPISILENRKLTILESIIVYLKQNGLKYSEIAKLLDRDQRNIRTIYKKAMEKI